MRDDIATTQIDPTTLKQLIDGSGYGDDPDTVQIERKKLDGLIDESKQGKIARGSTELPPMKPQARWQWEWLVLAGAYIAFVIALH